jgi:type I restriction enzyme S subunit
MNREVAKPVKELVEELVPRRRFQPYPEYRDSGVKWLCLLPQQWKTVPLKRLFRIVNGSTPKSSNDAFWDGEIPWATPDDLGSLSTVEIRETARRITRGGYESCGTTLVPAGSIVVSTRAPIGHLALAAVPLCVNQGCRCLVPCSSVDSRYYYYALLAGRQELESRGQGSTFRELGRSELASVFLSYPPIDEQQAIAGFLRHETACIDALIAKKQRLIELLAEKREALIARVVTGGLDTDARTEDAHVEWFESLPAHWELKKLKYIVPGITVGIVVTPAKYYVDEGVPCLRSLNISSGRVNKDDLVFISPESNELHRKSKIHTGDIVIVRTGQTGTAVVVTGEFDGANCIDLVIVRRSKRILPEYLHYFINSRSAARQIEAKTVGSIQGHYNTYTVGELLVPTPSLNEQRAIIAELDGQCGCLGRLIATVSDGVAKLREYRSALISAAVTGKIDVRNCREDAPCQ